MPAHARSLAARRPAAAPRRAIDGGVAPRLAPAERRTRDRLPLDVACKLREANTLRFTNARTSNVSRSGALLTIEAMSALPRPIAAGDVLDLALSVRPTPILRSEDVLRVTVVRALPALGARQTLAVRFDRELAEDLLPAAPPAVARPAAA